MRSGAKRLLVDGRPDRFQPMTKMRQAFRVADHEVTARHETTGQAIHELLLRLPIEVNHDVAAEDDLERLGERRLALQEVQVMKAHPVAQLGLHAEVAVLRTKTALEMRPHGFGG